MKAVVFVAMIAAVSAAPVINDEGEVLMRQKREENQGLGGNGVTRDFTILGPKNPSGESVTSSYGNSFKYDDSIDAIWAKKDKKYDSTLNLGGSHFEDPVESSNWDKSRMEYQGFGSGGINSGMLGFGNSKGSGGSLSYGYGKGYGHDVGVDAMAPIWSNKDKSYGDSTLNLGGGLTQHFGGQDGSQTLDKKLGISFVHNW